MTSKWDLAAIWQRIFGLLGLALLAVDGLSERFELDTGGVVFIVSLFMGGNAAIKATSNLAKRSGSRSRTVAGSTTVSVPTQGGGEVKVEQSPVVDEV